MHEANLLPYINAHHQQRTGRESFLHKAKMLPYINDHRLSNAAIRPTATLGALMAAYMQKRSHLIYMAAFCRDVAASRSFDSPAALPARFEPENLIL